LIKEKEGRSFADPFGLQTTIGEEQTSNVTVNTDAACVDEGFFFKERGQDVRRLFPLLVGKGNQLIGQ